VLSDGGPLQALCQSIVSVNDIDGPKLLAMDSEKWKDFGLMHERTRAKVCSAVDALRGGPLSGPQSASATDSKSSAASPAASATAPPSATAAGPTKSELEKMKIGELRRLLTAAGVDFSDFVEKADLTI
jgi:hypothetical protein